MCTGKEEELGKVGRQWLRRGRGWGGGGAEREV